VYREHWIRLGFVVQRNVSVGGIFCFFLYFYRIWIQEYPKNMGTGSPTGLGTRQKCLFRKLLLLFYFLLLPFPEIAEKIISLLLQVFFLCMCQNYAMCFFSYPYDLVFSDCFLHLVIAGHCHKGHYTATY
jgi:hypothetical protein